jgi:hypothetical protein
MLLCACVCFLQAGFGADIGLEKFMNIKCRASGLKPDAAGEAPAHKAVCLPQHPTLSAPDTVSSSSRRRRRRHVSLQEKRLLVVSPGSQTLTPCDESYS